MQFKSNSQAGQDYFVYKIIGTSGTFLDIGCNDPQYINNTYSLEKVGWKGVCIDIDDYSQKYSNERTATFIQADLLSENWFDKFSEKNTIDYSKPIDYLSFDIDEASVTALSNFPFNKLNFKLITVEHDKYRFGQLAQDRISEILRDAGYKICCSNVSCKDSLFQPFEDWYYNPRLIDETSISHFMCDGLDGSIIAKF